MDDFYPTGGRECKETQRLFNVTVDSGEKVDDFYGIGFEKNKSEEDGKNTLVH